MTRYKKLIIQSVNIQNLIIKFRKKTNMKKNCFKLHESYFLCKYELKNKKKTSCKIEISQNKKAYKVNSQRFVKFNSSSKQHARQSNFRKFEIRTTIVAYFKIL